ncbi:EAL domain-containing protein [Trinickia violacea]|uniref:EAL domain-containing protein n=1 Tax=Trinickia violacea TaxID=2571746 RepID=A0A4V1EH62_9BURK|nr:EAL domain-containing protein [Trinickia violacea]QCP49160.1 EAL domain-containing protein [Trinickia violacea]
MTTRRDLTLAGLLPQLARDETGWYAIYDSVTLRSAFQPVLSIAHKRIVGYEALLRATAADGRAITPDELFGAAQSFGAALTLERLTRCLHFANFAEQNVATDWLFVNALPRLFQMGWPHHTFVDELCAHFGLPHSRIVIEVLEQPANDEALLAQTVELLRERDFLIAIDDFGTGLSNFDRVWQFRPDIVKLDRSLVTRIASTGTDHQFVTHLVTMLHRAGAMVLAEGIETESELMTLMSADIDFVQGFWLARPQASIDAANAATPALIESMWERFNTRAKPHSSSKSRSCTSFETVVLAGARAYEATGDLAQAAERAFRVPEARRVFVIDAHGEQQRPSIAAAGALRPERLAPLFPDIHSNWSRRAYFKRALASPGRVAVMGPHFSPSDGKDCYTAAVAVTLNGALDVFCVDFLMEAHTPVHADGT